MIEIFCVLADKSTDVFLSQILFSSCSLSMVRITPNQIPVIPSYTRQPTLYALHALTLTTFGYIGQLVREKKIQVKALN